jgi:hypothetical protein
MKAVYGMLFLLGSLCACHSAQRKQPIADTTPRSATKEVAEPVQKAAVDTGATARSLVVHLEADTGTVRTRGYLSQGPDTCTIVISRGGELVAGLVPDDPKGNIRFTQIILPGGKADGPFGRSLRYPVAGKGVYRLIIGQNLMAGDPWTGAFTLNVQLK